MVYKNFNELIQHMKTSDQPQRVVVAAAEDEHTLKSVLKAQEDRVIKPILVGDQAKIKAILDNLGKTLPEEDIYSAYSTAECANLSVKLVREGKADFIMKGHLTTSELLRAVVSKDTGLGTGRTMSHMAINEVPKYHKLLVTTDGGMILTPTLEDKKNIIINAVNALRSMGYEEPKVGVLSAAEEINPKLQDSVDAAALKEMNRRGQISNCIVEGPISFDLAVVKERAIEKGYNSPCAGEVDILVAPNITAGNILGKCLVEMAGAKMAGLVIGARCPIVVTSRGSSAEEKYLALNLAAAITQQKGD